MVERTKDQVQPNLRFLKTVIQYMQKTSRNSIKSIVSDIKTVSLLKGSTALPSSSHLMGAGFPVPDVLCHDLSEKNVVPCTTGCRQLLYLTNSKILSNLHPKHQYANCLQTYLS